MPSASRATANHCGVLQPHGGPRERLDRRALREPADPGRAPAAEPELVLPGDAPCALDRVAADLSGHLGDLGVVRLGEEQLVHAPEGAQPLDLDALPGVRLPDEAAAGEAHAPPVGERRLRRPPLGVAADRLQDDRHPRGGQQPVGGLRIRIREHGRELAAPRALERLRQGGARVRRWPRRPSPDRRSARRTAARRRSSDGTVLATALACDPPLAPGAGGWATAPAGGGSSELATGGRKRSGRTATCPC